MKARTPKGYDSLPPSEKQAIADMCSAEAEALVARQLEEVITRILKLVLINLNIELGVGKERGEKFLLSFKELLATNYSWIEEDVEEKADLYLKKIYGEAPIDFSLEGITKSDKIK